MIKTTSIALFFFVVFSVQAADTAKPAVDAAKPKVVELSPQETAPVLMKIVDSLQATIRFNSLNEQIQKSHDEMNEAQKMASDALAKLAAVHDCKEPECSPVEYVDDKTKEKTIRLEWKLKPPIPAAATKTSK